MVFYWNLSESKSLHIPRTLLSILADFNSAIVWIVLACPFISNSFRPLTKFWGIVQNSSIHVHGTWIDAFSVLCQSPTTCLSLCFSLIFILWSSEIYSVVHYRQWSGRPVFKSRSRHTKDFKNGTWYLLAYHLVI